MSTETGLSIEDIDDLERSKKRLKDPTLVKTTHQHPHISYVPMSSPSKLSYKEKLVCSNSKNASLSYTPGLENSKLYSEEENIFNSEDFIPLSSKEKLMLYKHWESTLIFKMFGKKIGYNYLLQKINFDVEIIWEYHTYGLRKWFLSDEM